MEEKDEVQDLKAARKHFSRLGLMYFLGVLIIYGMQALVSGVVQLLKPEWLADPNISLILGQGVMYVIGIPLLVLLVRRVPAEEVEQHPMKAGHFVQAAFISYALMILSNVAGLVITFVIGAFKGSEVDNRMLEIVDSINLPLLFVFTVLCAPIIEEYTFRKLLVDRTIRYGQGVSVLLSGLMFGLFHGNLNQFVYAFSLGAFLAFLYAKTGNIKVTIGIHMIVNFMGTIAGSLVMDGIDIGELERISQSGDPAAITAFYTEHLLAMSFLVIYFFCVAGVVITGLVLLIVALAMKRVTFAPGQVQLPRGKRFRTVILNVGMLLFCIFWIIVILLQLLS